jgi:hypothetical protein
MERLHWLVCQTSQTALCFMPKGGLCCGFCRHNDGKTVDSVQMLSVMLLAERYGSDSR